VCLIGRVLAPTLGRVEPGVESTCEKPVRSEKRSEAMSSSGFIGVSTSCFNDTMPDCGRTSKC
jgi:hypothetical protein